MQKKSAGHILRHSQNLYTMAHTIMGNAKIVNFI